MSRNKVPQFLSVPIELHFNLNLTSGAKSLFSIFYLFHNSDKGCYAANHYLSRMTGLDERSITRNIKLLEELKYIIVKNKKSTSKRRIFMNNYKEIYFSAAEKIYSNNRSPEKFNSEEYKILFTEALNNYINKNLEV